MLEKYQKFHKSFGFSIPEPLKCLFDDSNLLKSAPVSFRFKHVGFIIEIQYFLDIDDSRNYDLTNKRIKFAVTSDGFEMVIDLNSDDLPILQNEYGDLDKLGVTLKDLLNAECYGPN